MKVTTEAKSKYPKITVDHSGLNTKEIAFITNSIIQNLSEIFQHRGVVHRTFNDKNIIIEVKSSGITA